MARPYENVTTNCGVCCAWIAPDGKVTHLDMDTLGMGSHCSVAENALNDPTGGRELDRLGYVHLSYGCAFMGSGSQTPTQAQLDSLFDLAEELRARGRKAYGIDDFIKHWQAQDLQEVAS